jgi:Tfp pilus assembly protein PilN
MNAVNLIPADGRKRRASVSASPLTLGLLAGLIAILVGAVLYVSTLNNVTARKSELSSVTASVTSWQAAANSYASVVHTAQARTQQLGSVRQLADSRFPWSQLLSQIAGLMPAKSALSSLQATTASPAATSATTATTPTQPAVQLSGCAASQSMVAATMDALRRVTGVSAVTLASAGDDSASSASSASSGSGAGAEGGCPFPVQFQVSLVLDTSSASASTPAVTGTPATATDTTTSPSAGTSTGAAQ